MMIDDDTLKQLLRINDELMQLCKFLNEKRDMETSPIATARPYLVLADKRTFMLVNVLPGETFCAVSVSSSGPGGILSRGD